MKHGLTRRVARRAMRIRARSEMVFALMIGFAVLAGISGCESAKSERAAEMTSYSSKEAKGAAPELFTIPQEQMSHVQVVTIAPAKMTRKLRLTGAVAYNAFATTPVITQVGGPVARILQ